MCTESYPLDSPDIYYFSSNYHYVLLTIFVMHRTTLFAIVRAVSKPELSHPSS